MARLGRVPRAWVILIGLIVIPSLYSWVNIGAFHDPYKATENIKVAVVNEDKGTYNPLTGKVTVGEDVVKQLHENDQMGWQFMERDEADSAVKNGDVYASVTIPENFSEELVGILSGTYTTPSLEYRVNEKQNAIAVKITDTAANSLDKQITSAFRQSVATAASKQVHDKGTDVENKLLKAADSTSGAFDETVAEIDSSRERLERIQDRLLGAQDSVRGARGTVDDVAAAMDSAQRALGGVQQLITDAQGNVGDFTDKSTAAFVQGATAVAEGTAQAQGTIADLSAGLTQASGRFDSATSQATAAIDASDQSLAQLKELLNSPTLSPATTAALNESISKLESGNEANKKLLGSLNTLSQDAAGAAGHLKAGSEEVAQAAADTKATSQVLRDTVDNSLPEINRAMGSIGSTAGALAATLDSSKATMQEADGLLEGVAQQLGATKDTLDSFDGDLASLQEGMQAVRGDVAALRSATNSQVLQNITGLDSEEIGNFFAEPIQIKQETIYPVKSYGSAMAALFTNLSLWIGAFVLMVIFRLEVDKEGFKRVTVRQAYLGRFLLMAVMVVLQSLVLTIGELIMGVQTVNPFAFVVTGVLIALAYLSVIYALSTSLGHLGRGLCVVLVIIQIPGASGLYPIELMPNFFRAIYPLLPFTYGIEAMRETIGGFYGNHYAKYMAVLALIFVTAFFGGMIVRKALSHFNLLFNRELKKTELFNYENVQVVGSGYRIADIIQALDSRSALKEDLERRKHDYGRWIRVIAVIGVLGVVVLAVAAWALPGQKPLLLGLWTAWSLALVAVLLAFDYVRSSLAQSEELVELDDDEITHPDLVKGEA